MEANDLCFRLLVKQQKQTRLAPHTAPHRHTHLHSQSDNESQTLFENAETHSATS